MKIILCIFLALLILALLEMAIGMETAVRMDEPEETKKQKEDRI